MSRSSWPLASAACRGCKHWSTPRQLSCRRCGSTLFFRSTRWPGELHVVRSNFDTPLDREPQLHVFYDTHAPWLPTADDGLPRKPAPSSD